MVVMLSGAIFCNCRLPILRALRANVTTYYRSISLENNFNTEMERSNVIGYII